MHLQGGATKVAKSQKGPSQTERSEIVKIEIEWNIFFGLVITNGYVRDVSMFVPKINRC